MIRVLEPQAMVERFRDFVMLLSLRYFRDPNVTTSLVDCGVCYHGRTPVCYSESWEMDGIEYLWTLDFKSGAWTWTCYPPSLDAPALN